VNLWAEYLRERLGKLVLERDAGFAVYQYVVWDGVPAVYIEEIYVSPASRRKHVAVEMADAIVEEARAKGCQTLVGSVLPSANGATRSCQGLIAYGMSVAQVDPSSKLIIFLKPIGD
jgi:ribosomal protein S18 acetylase RimI-like enzyme